MKTCAYCGKEYPDNATVCAIDGQPLVTNSPRQAAPSTLPPEQSPKPAPANVPFMTRLRSLHLYLGCIFAPMLLFLALSGIWQTLGFHHNSSLLSSLSSIHMSHGVKKSGTGNLTSPLMLVFIVLTTTAFIITTFLGIIMALKYGRSRRAAIYCLAFGVAFPMLLILIRLVL